MLKINQREVRAFAKRVKNLRKRYDDALAPMMASEATALRRDVLRMAPSDIEGYRKALSAVVVKGEPQGWKIAGVVVIQRKVRLRDDAPDQQRLVLYVQPTEAGERMPWVMALASVIWTPDALPAEPPRKLATLMARRVSKREFEWAAGQSAAKRPGVVKMLEAAKIPVLASKAEIKQRVAIDLGFEVLRAEFGLGGAKAQAHWRPALKRSVVRVRMQGLTRLADWLASSTGMRYAPRGSVVRRRVSPKLAASVSGFQSRIRP